MSRARVAARVLHGVQGRGVERAVVRFRAGVYISGIVKGGPADKAGLAAGDVITEFNGEPVSDANQLITMISEHEVGERVKLTVSRNGTERYEEVIVVLGELDLDNVRAGD